MCPPPSHPSAPQVARQFPEPMPLVLKVRLGATPTVTFHTNNATMRLQPFVEVLAPTSNSAFQYLFSLNVVSEVGWMGLARRWVTLKETSLPPTRFSLFIHAGLLAIHQCAKTFLPQDLCTCCTLCLGHTFPDSWQG